MKGKTIPYKKLNVYLRLFNFKLEKKDYKPNKKICSGQCNATGKATGHISENTLRAEQKLIAHSALPTADAYYYENNSTANGDTYR